MRRRARSGEGPEYYSLVRALRALDHADVALLVLDATDGVTHQDQRLAERVDASGSPVVILLNKWDLLGTEDRLVVSEAVADRLAFLGYAPVLRVSAKTGLGVQRLLPAVREAINAYHRRIPTGRLNDGLRSAQSATPVPGAPASFTACKVRSTRQRSRCLRRDVCPPPTSATSSALCGSVSPSGRLRSSSVCVCASRDDRVVPRPSSAW